MMITHLGYRFTNYDFPRDYLFCIGILQEDSELYAVENPSGKEREPLQEVDDLVAKAISFRNVSKVI